FQANEHLDFNLQAAKSRFDEEIIDFNTFRPVAGASPGEFIFNNRFEQRESGGETTSIKLEAALEAEFLGMSHQLLFGGLDQTNRSYTRTLTGANRVWNPRTDPIRHAPAEFRANYPNSLPPRPPRGKPTPRAFYVSDQAALFDERLRLVMGARHTETR